jgi:ABC-2 type transport system ATP-binding protein
VKKGPYALRVENAGKQFDIGIERQMSVRQHLTHWVRGHQPTRSFWAVRGVNIELKHGESLGIIGPNGAGKSTLMRLLAGIYQPSEGRVESDGRVNPFLALGVSLLPQLTVLQNLRLCAALQGYSGREFRDRLDRIIEFSELHDYLYAAVADLSAGWASRVAFSIAIHTDINILLIDETLAVGDNYFQAKCLKRFEKLQQEGSTVVLVSHSLDDVARICGKALYLDGGSVAGFGPSAEMVKSYQADLKKRTQSLG